jgi:hypothetical protein
MIEINWSFITNSAGSIDHDSLIEPLLDQDYEPLSPLIKDIVKTRKGVVYLKCPATTDFIKNVFVFKAPFDLTLEIDVDDKSGNGKIVCENISQNIFSKIIDTRFLFDDQRGINPYPMLGIDWMLMFQSNYPVLLQSFPAFFHRSDFVNKTMVVPGEFDISKWTRPVELVFEVKNLKEKIVIKKGDALSYYRFICDDKIKLVKQPTPWNESQQCAEIVNKSKFRPLKERYEALSKLKLSCSYDHKS